MKTKPNVIIVVSGLNAGLLAIKIAELKSENPNCEIVTIEEAKEKGLMPTYEIKAPPPIPDLQVTLTDNFYSDGRSLRNKRREDERKAKKGKRLW